MPKTFMEKSSLVSFLCYQLFVEGGNTVEKTDYSRNRTDRVITNTND